jgi:hypothetical protein
MKKIDGRLEHIGKVQIFECKMCGKMTRDMFRLWPHLAVIKLLPQWDRVSREVCKACARRELGSKRWKMYVEM